MNAEKDNGLKLLKKHLSAHETAPLYIFHGEEAFLREHYINMLKKELLPEGLDGFNLHRLNGKGLDFQVLRDSVETMPLMSDKKLILVEDFDLFKANAATKTNLEEYFSNPLPDTACLVFVYDILDYKPDGRTKLGGILKKNACVVEFELQESAQLISWLKRHFSAHNKQIDSKDAEYLIFRCGSSMTSLKNEIEKLAAYSKKEIITREAIDRLVIPVLEARSFDLANAVADGKMRKAINVLQDMKELREEPLMILGALSRQIRGLYVARLASQQSKGAKAVMEVMGYKSRYPAELLLSSAQKRSISWCRKAVKLCAEADMALKSFSQNRERVLELLLAELH